ncbi:hypothetical protein R1flu_015867 [Riccia fluitans]|uniref:Uncharacterized protein n=1 Tax=Riccia fluitans TaxID=41844 RepID=A0ABD1YK76_9MARC
MVQAVAATWRIRHYRRSLVTSPPPKRRRVYKANFGTKRIRPQCGHVVRRYGGRTRTPRSLGAACQGHKEWSGVPGGLGRQPWYVACATYAGWALSKLDAGERRGLGWSDVSRILVTAGGW